jgi:release factor glutamine methyltransferase
VLDKPRTYLHAHLENTFDQNILDLANNDLKKRLNRVPIAYITGKKEFYGREFIVTKDTLIPRPESEMAIEFLKDILIGHTDSPKKDTSIIDVGTGSGILGITAKLELPSLDVTLSDNSEAALNIARENAQKLKADVKIINTNLLDNVGTFNIIIGNLPYVDKVWETSRETDWEPSSAIFAADKGLFLIKKLIESTKDKLTCGGYLILESDPRQHDEIIGLAKNNSLKMIKDEGFIQSFRLFG